LRLVKVLIVVQVLVAAILVMALLVIGNSSPTGATNMGTPTATPVVKATGSVININLPVSIRPGICFTDGLTEMAERFNDRVTQYKITVYPGSSMGTLEETFEMCRTGTVEMTQFNTEYLGDNNHLFEAQCLPFAFTNTKQNNAFDQAITTLKLGDILATEYNQKYLAVHSADMQGYAGTSAACTTMADWKGKIVSVANTMEAEIITLLGGAPVSLPFQDGYPALQKGTIDAALESEETVYFMKWTGVIKYFTRLSMTGGMNFVTVNLDFYNSMTPDAQQALVEEGKWYQDWILNAAADELETALKGLPKEGVQVSTLSAEEMAKWRSAVQPVWDKYMVNIGADKLVVEAALAAATR
jgi:TRAP-type transport system periplasmic protein